jgi:hypothetical protein
MWAWIIGIATALGVLALAVSPFVQEWLVDEAEKRGRKLRRISTKSDKDARWRRTAPIRGPKRKGPFDL